MRSQADILSDTDGRAISNVLGIPILIAIVIILAVVTAATIFSVGKSGIDAAAVHGQGAFRFTVTGNDEGEEQTMQIQPAAVTSEPNSKFGLLINGYEVYAWEGHDPVEINCLYPGDDIRIYTFDSNGNTRIVQEYPVETSLDCSAITAMDEKFEYAMVNGSKERVNEEYVFGLSIDPDGPGPDDTLDHPVYKQNIGPIPLTNDWHYIEKYDQRIEGFDPPVWVVVMTDNVHWKDAAGPEGDLNWTDDPSGDPGSNSYTLSSDPTLGHVVNPVTAGTEPTNDIYMVFKPGCDQSEVRIVTVEAGYHNQILINGSVAVDNTAGMKDDTDLTAPGVYCPWAN